MRERARNCRSSGAFLGTTERYQSSLPSPRAATLHFVTPIKTYSSRIEADLASIELRAAGIAATIVGVGVGMEGGAEGVRLMVPDDQAEAALEVLGNS